MRLKIPHCSAFLIFCYLFAVSAEASTIPLPTKLGKIGLNEQLPKNFLGTKNNVCVKGEKTYSINEGTAREMWRAILPTLDNKNTVAEVSTLDRAVAGVTFWIRGVRFPKVVSGLKSIYGKARFKETAETSDFPRWQERRWEDERTVLILSVDPESLEWNLQDQVVFVSIYAKKKNALARCHNPHIIKPLLDEYIDQLTKLKDSLFYAEANDSYTRGDKANGDKWLLKGIKSNDAWSQYLMGFNYDNGRGVEVNHAEAIKWHRLASAQGHWQSSFDLGTAYEQGRGVEKNLSEALKLYRLAVQQGFPGPDAQESVNRLAD